MSQGIRAGVRISFKVSTVKNMANIGEETEEKVRLSIIAGIVGLRETLKETISVD